MSEVIARARKYHEQVTGAKGPVIESHTNPGEFEQSLKDAGVEVEKPAVQDWLENMTYDKMGLINLFDWGGLLDINILLQDMFRVPNLKTGRMEPLITALTDEEEEQFKNMLCRMHTVFQVARTVFVADLLPSSTSATTSTKVEININFVLSDHLPTHTQ